MAWSWKSLSTVLEVVSAWKGMEKWLMIPSGCRKTQNAETVSLFLGRPSSRLTGAADSNVPEVEKSRINLIIEFCLVLTMLGDVELCHFRFVVRTPNLKKLVVFILRKSHCTVLRNSVRHYPFVLWRPYTQNPPFRIKWWKFGFQILRPP